MFKKIIRAIFPNPFHQMLKKTARKKGTRILLAWNRGLGDIPLGLYPLVASIRSYIPNATITFVTRSNLMDGFSMLEGINVVVAPDWKRGEKKKIPLNLRDFDLVIEEPDPTYWMKEERGKIIPKLKWNPKHDLLYEKFELKEGKTYIAIQPITETTYGLWRNLPTKTWEELFALTASLTDVVFLLLGFQKKPIFNVPNVIDLRGQTSLFELLSILKNRCYGAILPDSGILSYLYYLDAFFPIKLLSLWADPNHGILKQNVSSPNPQLEHIPLIGAKRDLSSISARQILNQLFPLNSVPLIPCIAYTSSEKKRGAILLAGGDGTRLGIQGPKGTCFILGKSLFEWILEKAPMVDFPIAIMTSPNNHDQTVAFLQKHSFFGREIYFFQQPTHPILDRKKKPMPFLAPNGNGSLFKAFYESPLLSIFQEKKVELLSIVPIDNLFANINDAHLFDALGSTDNDVIIQCVEACATMPPMGSLVTRKTPFSSRLEILEYTEVSPVTDSHYKYTGSMAIRFPFFQAMAHQSMPPHFVWKQIQGHKIWGWKQEFFLFDALPFAKKVSALLADVNQAYAPIKTKDHVKYLEEMLKC